MFVGEVGRHSRNTFETVVSMDVEWPYPKPVFVLSRSLVSVPEKVIDKAEIVQGDPEKITKMLNDRGYNRLYIDGGKTIQGFLAEDKIDEMIIARLPILLGGGVPLFGSLPENLMFDHLSTKVLLNKMVVSHYIRDR